MSLDKLFSKLKGGAGSGNWGHGGRPGSRGGSAPKSGIGAAISLMKGSTADVRRQIAKSKGDKDIAVIKETMSTKGKPLLVIESPYNENFVSDLRNNVPSSAKTWDSKNKRWLIDKEIGGEAARKAVEGNYLGVDGNKFNKTQLSQIRNAVKTTRIKNDQKVLKGKESEINKTIDNLTERINSYSFNSRSSSKMAAITERARLQYVLSDMKAKPESLQDIQIKSLAKTAREYADS